MNVLGQDLKDGDILGGDALTVVDRTPIWTHVRVQRGALTLSSVIGNNWSLNIERPAEKRVVVLEGKALETARRICGKMVPESGGFWDAIRDAVGVKES